MEKKKYTVAVDLGSSNVTVAVGGKNAEGLLEVLSIVSKPVEGVNAGKIENIELVSGAIREAVSEVEKQLGIHVTEAYAGISGEFVRCARHTDHVFVLAPESGVCQKDVDALFERMRNVQSPDDEMIMERVPQNYMVDDTQEVKNPVGSFGRKLSSTFNYVLCLKTPRQRLDMALKRLGIQMTDAISCALATPEAVLMPDEKEEGVAVVDMGAGVTDVTVYYRNVVRYIASIPMGAAAINRDIRTMSVPEKYVESLKQKYGSAVADLSPEDKLVRVNGRTSREAKDVLLRNLATVIEARATDIAEFVAHEIKDSGFSGKLPYGIVLTGGSAKLKDIDELFRRVTGMEVRIAAPETGLSEASTECISTWASPTASEPDRRLPDPAYATAVGILLKGIKLDGGDEVIVRPEVKAPEAPKQPACQTPQPQPQQPKQPAQSPAARFAALHQSAAAPVGAAPAASAPVTEPVPPVDNRQPEDNPDGEPATVLPTKPKKWNIFKKAIDKINDGFNAADDEEI